MFSNFTIKQALPRLIIAAIAINLSYILCALLVDASNLLGQSIFALLDGLHGDVIDGTSLIAMVELVLAGGAAAATASTGIGIAVAAAFIAGVGSQLVVGVILMFTSFLLGIALAIFIALLILAARQALIVILVVIAPIAFALYILPGTKSLFDRWRKLLTTMLVFFPLFALLYGGAQLAAGILIAASGNFQGAEAAKLGGVFLLMGIGAQFLPLFATPWLLKNGSGELGKVAAKLQQKAKPLTQAPGKAGRKKLGDVASLTGMAAKKQFRDFASDRRARGRRGGRLLDRIAHSSDKYDTRKKALENEIGQQGKEYHQRDELAGQLYDRAGNAADNTKRSESALESRRLTTSGGRAARQDMTTAGEDLKTVEGYVEANRLGYGAPAGAPPTAGALSRQAMTNSQKNVKTQEARVDTARLGTHAGEHAEHEHHEAEDDHKTAENEVAAAGLQLGSTGAAARQRRIVSDDDLKRSELDVQTAGLQTQEGIDARTALAAAQNINKGTELDVQTIGLRTTTGAAARQTLTVAEDTNKTAESDVLAAGLKTTTGIDARSARTIAEDLQKGTELDVQSIGLRTTEGAAARQVRANAEDINKGATIDVEIDRRATTEGAAAIAGAQSAELRKKVEDAGREKSHLTGNQNEYLQVAAAQGELDVSKSTQQQLEAELKTKAGIAANVTGYTDTSGNWVAAKVPGIDTIAAQAIKDAATQKAVITDATSSANRVLVNESAQLVIDDAGIAKAAGGIAEHGEAIAKARAQQTGVDEFRKVVGSVKLLHSQDDNKDLLPKFDDLASFEALSDEELSADAGLIASRQHRASQIKLQKKLFTLSDQIESIDVTDPDPAKAAAKQARKTALVEKFKNVVQQVSTDRSGSAFGIGDEERGANDVGAVGSKDIYTSTRDRLLTHMSAGALSKMDPDDIKLVYEMYTEGKLGPQHVDKVKQAYEEWQDSDQLKHLLQDKHRKFLDVIDGTTAPLPPTEYTPQFTDISAMSPP